MKTNLERQHMHVKVKMIHVLRDRSLFIEGGGGAGANKGWVTIFYAEV